MRFPPSVCSRARFRSVERVLASSARRGLYRSPACLKAYEYSNVLGDDFASPTTIGAVIPEGFAMQIGLLVPTPVVLLNGQIFLWNVPPVAPSDLTWRGFTPESFKVFEVVTPKPEMIVVGTGKSMVPLAPHLRKYLRELGYQVEVQDSVRQIRARREGRCIEHVAQGRAAASLNMLAEEGRSVAGALLPLRPIHAVSGQPVLPVPPS